MVEKYVTENKFKEIISKQHDVIKKRHLKTHSELNILYTGLIISIICIVGIIWNIM